MRRLQIVGLDYVQNVLPPTTMHRFINKNVKAVAHWTLKGLTILYQKSTKSVQKSVCSFFQGGGGGGEHGKC